MSKNDMVMVPRELRSVLSMILNALDRDASEGKAARGEMAEELRAILGRPADQHHGEPVALPARKKWVTPLGSAMIDIEADGWNDCLAEIAKLGPLYSRPVQGEPVAQCASEDSWNCKYCRKTESCQALKDPRNFGEPSAPVEIDERAAFEAHIEETESQWDLMLVRVDAEHKIHGHPRDIGEYAVPETHAAWKAWQARAALARKP